MTAVLPAARRMRTVIGAFMWLGVTENFAYPLMMFYNNIIGPPSIPIMYYFVARLVSSGPEVGLDYYTFVIIGFTCNNALSGPLRTFSREVDSAIQQGRFETFLVQPISWYTLPFGLAAWPALLGIVNGSIVAIMGFLLGAEVRFGQIPIAILIVILGMASTHTIGTFAASVRLLSKRADPVIGVYNLVASVFSGALFPVSMLPWFLKPISYLIPHTYVLTAVRRVLMKEGDAIAGPSLTVSILVLALGTPLLYGLFLFVFGRALDFGRKYGVLDGY